MLSRSEAEGQDLLPHTNNEIYESRFVSSEKQHMMDHPAPHGVTNGDSDGPGDDTQAHETKRALTAITLLGVLYANCIGSGYGFEDSVGAAGPLVTLLFCLVIPWIWCLPTGLAVSELSTAVRSNSGVLMWVNVAFHPVVSFMCVMITVFITFVGNASYPTLAANYVNNVVTLTDGTRAAVKIACVVVCAALNISGVEIVGSASVLMSIVTMAPFLIFSLKQLFVGGYSWAAMTHVDLSKIDWPTFLSISSWNYSNLENAGAVVEEVANPRKTLFRAMIPLMFSTYLAYFFPVAAGVSAFGPDQDYDLWKSGYWSQVAEVVCGAWLKYFLFAGAIVTSFGYTMTSICCTSRLLAGMGAMDIFPHKISRWLGAYHPRVKTPVNAIVLNSVVTLVFSLSLSFDQIVALAQALYCFRLLFVYASVIRLRMVHPNLPRPYALPCGLVGCCLFIGPAAIFSCAVCILSAQSSLGIGLASASFLVVGPLVSWLYVKFVRPFGFEGKVVKFIPGDAVDIATRDDHFPTDDDASKPPSPLLRPEDLR